MAADSYDELEAESEETDLESTISSVVGESLDSSSDLGNPSCGSRAVEVAPEFNYTAIGGGVDGMNVCGAAFVVGTGCGEGKLLRCSLSLTMVP